MTVGERAAANFKESTRDYCKLMVELLQPIAPPGFSSDFLICIRNGEFKVFPQPLYRSENWREHRSQDPYKGTDPDTGGV